jgi:hypothetical protein
VAVAADAIQFALLPFVIGGVVSPVDDAIDVVTGVALTALLGFHWAFLPTFVAKLVPRGSTPISRASCSVAG